MSRRIIEVSMDGTLSEFQIRMAWLEMELQRRDEEPAPLTHPQASNSLLSYLRDAMGEG